MARHNQERPEPLLLLVGRAWGAGDDPERSSLNARLALFIRAAAGMAERRKAMRRHLGAHAQAVLSASDGTLGPGKRITNPMVLQSGLLGAAAREFERPSGRRSVAMKVAAKGPGGARSWLPGRVSRGRSFFPGTGPVRSSDPG